MKYSTTITLALATMATADWSLYCGDSCTDGTLVASGSDAVESCVSLGDTYDYCYIEANSIYYANWWKAIFYENADCEVTSVSGGLESKGLFDGDCTDAGSWKSYEVVVNA
ncbi:hypothetical protein N7494_000725 [Penicillium frequentans]|uniref:Cyanovirin-N domain-containing protein n=1 Tax=Penicillium frequentans TaxID=3151616 RepID=A0AAD6D6C4_9EURO|nr:hypothetical protein N7494_000725 [Penicillium glabrum]